MRYSLWSNNRLVGHTTLDLACHQNAFRHGFLEPSAGAEPLLVDATGVAAICATRPSDWSRSDDYLARFTRAVERREALNFVLIDERGRTFNSDFIRVYDLRDQLLENAPYDDDEDDPPDWEDAGRDDDLDADIFAEMDDDWEEELDDEFESRSSSWEGEDERWDTMQYYLQVFLKRAEDERPDFALPP
jgi:hypothetical protein